MNVTAAWNFFLLLGFSTLFFQVAISFTLKRQNIMQSPNYLPIFPAYLRMWHQLFFWDLQKWSKMLCSRFRRNSLKQSENLFFKATIALIKKKHNSEHTIFNQLLKLIWTCSIIFSTGALKKGQKAAGYWTKSWFQHPV